MKINTESLNNINACPEFITYWTGSFCISGSQFHVSGSENTCYFEDGVEHQVTCSNSTEVSWLSSGAGIFGVSCSLHNLEDGISHSYRKTKKIKL